ncbi:hypothetical protein WMF31_14510 [Sorangium sp. So ce1036]|uniref:hypothetical protein n=1 Tax=Sorangium sp. So ce1036 TaxID=3133328 RepID=UPI003F01B048
MIACAPRRWRPESASFRSRSPLRLPTSLLLPALLALLAGCESKMEPKECDTIRGDAFELVNKAQHCNTDADCRQSEWPGCAKPVSQATFEKIKPMAERYKTGKCEEPQVECKSPPESYCKQGLCVHRELGTTEGAGATPTDQIQIQ